MTEEEEKERCRQIQEIIVNEINRGGKVSDDEILESIEEIGRASCRERV